jgi:hypothetical protein
MAKSKIDAKEFMLQYGDRIGVGIAGLLALLFVVFAMLGSGGGVSAEQVNASSKKADEAIRRSEINPDMIALNDEPTVKRLSQIDELAKALGKPFTIDQLQLLSRFFEPEPLRGKFRSNPMVLQPLELAVEPLVGQFRVYDTRFVNNQEEVMILKLRQGASAPKLNNGNAFRPGNQPPPPPSGGLGLGGRGGAPGGGGMGLGGSGGPPGGLGGPGGGLGAPGGGGLGMGGPGGPGGAGRGGAQGGGGGRNTPTTPKTPAGNPGGDESIYTIEWRKDKDVTQNDILGVSIKPLRVAYIAATYPHGLQTDEIAKKLQIEKNLVERLYRKVEVQRRRIFPKGTQLPDGRIADKDLVELENPKDRTKLDYRTPEEADQLLASADEQMSARDRYALAGWIDVNMQNVANVMRSAQSVAKFNNEPFHVEKEPIIEGLVEYAGPRIAMKLPHLVRADYPDIMSKLPTLMGAVKKIKDGEKAKVPPPPKDGRLGSGGGDEFDDGKDNSNQNNPPKGNNEAPELSGPVPDYVPIRFLDVDLDSSLVGGATFEYRLRMVLHNPNYKRETEVAAPEFARDEFLFGNWSTTVRVTFEPDQMMYASDRERAKNATDDGKDRDKVPVQLHKWLGKVEVIGGSDRDTALVGDWWIEKLLVGRGQYIGRSPDLAGPAGESNLVQWVSHAVDTINSRIGADVQKKTRTTDLFTNSILVDFQGGAYQSYRSDFNKSMKKEDVPAEILILEPDGRVISRHMGDDRNLTDRKARYEHWKKWIDELGKPSDRKAAAPAGGSGKFGAGGAGGGSAK